MEPNRPSALDEFHMGTRIARLEWALTVMASWLVQAQTGFGAQDAKGIEAILRGEHDADVPGLK